MESESTLPDIRNDVKVGGREIIVSKNLGQILSMWLSHRVTGFLNFTSECRQYSIWVLQVLKVWKSHIGTQDFFFPHKTILQVVVES